MLKVKVKWAGFTGSPGYSNFYFDDPNGGFEIAADADACATAVHTFFNAIKGYFPNIVNFQVQNDVEQITHTTGNLFGVESIPAKTVIVGTGGAGGYSATSGAVVTWHTAGVRNGRRVRGRTFLVPVATNTYSIDGSLEGGAHTALNNAAAALRAPIGNLQLGVWSRPSAPGVEDGQFFPCSGSRVPDMVAVLRSRRD